MTGHLRWNCFYNGLDARAFITGCAVIAVIAFPVIEIMIGALYMCECPVAPAIPVYVLVCGILALLLMAMFALSKLLGPAAPHNTVWTVWILSPVLFTIIWFLYGSYHIYSIYPPNYDKNLTDTNRINNSIYRTALRPDHRLGLSLENQNQSLPNFNGTSMINNNQTLMEMIQTLALSNINSKTNREHLNAPRVTAAVPYCDKTLYLFAFWTTTLVYVVIGNTVASINWCS